MRPSLAHPVRVRVLALGLFLVAGSAAAGSAHAETPIPDPPTRWVTDRAGFLSPGAAQELDNSLADYARGSGHQVLVYVDHTTGGVPIEDWAVKAFEKWKLGRKGLDDGVALFIFSDDHTLRIEVGYGLEDRVTDALASRLINERIVPRIRAGDRDGAVREGVAGLVAATGAPPGSGEPVAESPARPQLSLWQLILGGIVILIILGVAITHPGLAWLMLMSIGSGRGGGGGFSGGGGGGGFSGGGGRSGGGGASGSW